jgi:DNA polymerase I
MTTATPPLVLVDGSSYLFRAFHALPPLKTRSGQDTGAIKGVISMLRLLLKQYPQSTVAVVFDAKGGTFRSEMYDQYKANRPPMPVELASQIEPIHTIIRAMGLPLLIIEGVEADDVIGTLARQAQEQGVPTLISTGDKDMAQLVNEHVTLLNTMTDERLDVEGVKAKFGLPPELIIDYLGLMGDKVDNIPGIPGVGPKTAVKWLLQYGSVQNLIAHADEVPGKAGENLRANIEQLQLSVRLATIKCDVALEFGPRDLAHKPADLPELLRLFQELEFRSWVRELEEQGIAASASTSEVSNTASVDEPTSAEVDATTALLELPAETEVQVLTDADALTTLCRSLSESKRVALAVHTDGAHFKQAQLIGLAFSLTAGQAVYIPLGHDLLGDAQQLPAEQVLAALKPHLESQALFKIGHDLKFISHVLRRYGIRLRGRRYDTMLQSYVLDSVAHRHTLEKLSERELGFTLLSREELLGKGRNKLEFAQLSVADAAAWAGKGVDYTHRLALILERRLRETGSLAEVYRYFEIPLVPVLTRMEAAGIRVDVDVLRQQSEELAVRLDVLEKRAYELAGEEFNLGSPAQLQKIFFEKLQYPVIAKTDKGQPSTAEPVLQELSQHYELPRVILEHRGLSKLKSTYTDKLPLDIQPDTGRIHSTFQQAVAATGRLSSTEPNLQNIPIRTDEGRRIRKAFIPADGKILLAADYSQVELRIMAHLSGDAGLIRAFAEGLDVHRATAAEIFGIPLEEVGSDQRRSAKAINFGLIYGMSAFGLANQLGIGRVEAQEYVDRYFQRYPGVRDYMENTRALAAEQGYVETLFGRRLYLPDIRARNQNLRKAAERTAINAPMQGTAADLIKQAMIDIDQWLKVAQLDARLVLQVHDELVFEVAEADLEPLKDGVRFRMMSAASLRVPLVVDLGWGHSWDEAH